MDVESLSSASSKIFEESVEKVNQSAKEEKLSTRIKQQVEAVRGSQLAVKLIHVADEINKENNELLQSSDSKRGRALDHFS